MSLPLKDKRKLLAERRLELAIAEKKAIKLARRNVNAFAQYCFVDPKSQEPIQQQWFHVAWHKHFDEHRRAGVIAPRNHGKTEQVSIIRTLFDLGRNPDLRIKIVSADKETSKKRVKACRTHIDTNKRLHRVFPELVASESDAEWSAYAITVNRRIISPDPSLEARGILASGVGGRADVLIGDDVVDFNNSIRVPGFRKVVKSAWHDVWMNLLEPDGRARWISTPWTNSDLTAELMANEEWKFLKTVVGPNLESIWPDKWPTERLHAVRRELSPRHFDRAYRGLAMSDEDRVFTDDSIQEAKAKGANVHRAMIPREWPRYTGVDLAISQKKGAKYTVFVTIAIDPATQSRYVVDIRRGHYSSTRTADILVEVFQKHQPVMMIVENNTYQQALIEWTQKTKERMPIVGMTTGAEKADLEMGVPGMAVEFENGMWVIPQDGRRHVTDCKCELCQLCRELADYPFAEYSDTLMATWLATRGLRHRRAAPEAIGGFGESRVYGSTTPTESTYDDTIFNPGRDPHPF